MPARLFAFAALALVAGCDSSPGVLDFGSFQAEVRSTPALALTGDAVYETYNLGQFGEGLAVNMTDVPSGGRQGLGVTLDLAGGLRTGTFQVGDAAGVDLAFLRRVGTEIVYADSGSVTITRVDGSAVEGTFTADVGVEVVGSFEAVPLDSVRPD